MMSSVIIKYKGEKKYVIVKESDIIFANEGYLYKDENIPYRINMIKNNIDSASEHIIYSHIIGDSSYDFEKRILFDKPILKMTDGFISIKATSEGLLSGAAFSSSTLTYSSHGSMTATCPIKVTPSTKYSITRYGNDGKYPDLIFVDGNGSLVAYSSWYSGSSFTTPDSCEYVIITCDFATGFELSIQ